MPKFIVKKGKTSQEFKDYWESLKDEAWFEVNIKKETKSDRMRRSYRALLEAVHNSGNFSVIVNGKALSTYDQLHDHYKICGCNGDVSYYQLGDFKTENIEEITKHLTDPKHHNWIVKVPKSWTVMTAKERQQTLTILINDCKLSMNNDPKVQEWISKITKEFI
ncbi:MAG: hypothetical protein GY928_08130 [Colwellia sp.]|nr:hypothetical protein [Colwellia sp.]